MNRPTGYKKPKAIFFDFDGVVLDSANIKTEAFGLLYKEWPEHQQAIRSYHLRHMGVSRFEKFRWISENLLKQPVTEDYLQSQGKRFSEICFEQIINAPFIPGVLSVLEWCKHNAQAFVVSGTPEGELKLIIAQRDLEGFFVEVCGTPRVKVEISKELLSRYRLDPTTCWFIGDGHTDQEAAYEVGIPFVAVDSIEMHAHWSALAGKLWLVNDLREVANFLYGV